MRRKNNLSGPNSVATGSTVADRPNHQTFTFHLTYLQFHSDQVLQASKHSPLVIVPALSKPEANCPQV